MEVNFLDECDRSRIQNGLFFNLEVVTSQRKEEVVPEVVIDARNRSNDLPSKKLPFQVFATILSNSLQWIYSEYFLYHCKIIKTNELLCNFRKSQNQNTFENFWNSDIPKFLHKLSDLLFLYTVIFSKGSLPCSVLYTSINFENADWMI